MSRALRLTAVAALALALAIPALAAGKTDALSLIPNDAVSVGVVRLADLRTSPLSSELFRQTDKVSVDGEAARFLLEAGLDPMKDIDLLVVAMSPKTTFGSEAEVVVAVNGRFNVDRLTKALAERGAVKKGGYWVLPEKNDDGDEPEGAVAFPDGSLAIIGSESAVAEALAARAAGGTSFLTSSGLGRETSRIDANASAWAVVDVARASRITGSPKVTSKSSPGQQIGAAIKNVSTVAMWAVDNGDSLKVAGFGIARDDETLVLLEDTLRGALAAMRLAAQDTAPELVGMLRKFSVSRTQDSVSVSGTIPAETLKKLAAKKRDAHTAAK